MIHGPSSTWTLLVFLLWFLISLLTVPVPPCTPSCLYYRNTQLRFFHLRAMIHVLSSVSHNLIPMVNTFTWLICSYLFNINSNCTPSTYSRSSPLAPQIRDKTTSYVCPQNQELPISEPYNSRIYLPITLAVFPLVYKLQWGRELIYLVHSCIFSNKCTTGMRSISAKWKNEFLSFYEEWCKGFLILNSISLLATLLF